MRDEKLNELKKGLNLLHHLSSNTNKISDAAVKCSYVKSEKNCPSIKTFYTWWVYKSLSAEAGEIMCPEQKQAFANISLTGNTVAQRVKDMAENLQVKKKSGVLCDIFSCSWWEHINNRSHLIIFIRGVDENFDIRVAKAHNAERQASAEGLPWVFRWVLISAWVTGNHPKPREEPPGGIIRKNSPRSHRPGIPPARAEKQPKKEDVLHKKDGR